jgi:hypothetical protein
MPDSTSSAASRPAVARYLLLSLATGVLELGVVLNAAFSGRSAAVVVAVGLTYQIAALLVRPVRLTRRSHDCLLIVGALVGFMAWRTSEVPWVLLSTVVTAAGLQGVRDSQLTHASVSTFPKRVSRIFGFLLGSMFVLLFLFLLPVAVLAVSLHDRQSGEEGRLSHTWEDLVPSRYALLMLVHQTHYFLYAYSLIFVLVGFYEPSRIDAAMAFSIGWVTYTISPLVLGRLRALPVLLVGHLLVACVMAMIATNIDNGSLVTCAWAIGGLGGGTVFCIKRLAREAEHPDDDLDSWENVGHVVGSLLAVVLVALLPLTAVFWAAGGFAIATMAVAVMNSHSSKADAHMGLDHSVNMKMVD